MSWFHHNNLIEVYREKFAKDHNIWNYLRVQIDIISNNIGDILAVAEDRGSSKLTRHEKSEIIELLDNLAKNLDAFFVVIGLGEQWLQLIHKDSRDSLIRKNYYKEVFDDAHGRGLVYSKAKHFNSMLNECISGIKGWQYTIEELKKIAMVIAGFMLSAGLQKEFLKLIRYESS